MSLTIQTAIKYDRTELMAFILFQFVSF